MKPRAYHCHLGTLGGAFTKVTAHLKGEVTAETTNRINMPDVAEKILAEGCRHGPWPGRFWRMR